MKPRITSVLIAFLSLFFLIAQLDAGQCKAITKKGTQCKREAVSGSDYCWQHGGSKKNNSSVSSKSTDQSPATKQSKKETTIGTTATGKSLYQGPRGGVYHYSKSGKKVYHKRR